MTRGRLRGAALALATLALLGPTLGCSSDADRARDHLEQGRELLAQGEVAKARLELQSALRYAPDSVEANNELALLEMEAGNAPVALAHMSEAYRLDPTDSEAALNLASLLVADQPDRAEALIEGVIHRDPQNPLGYIGRSNLALSRGRIPAAGFAAREAMKVAPDDPRPDWHFAYVMQAMIREAQLTGEKLDDSIYESALGALERYIKKGGEHPWRAQLQEARVFAAWPGYNPQAQKQFRIAIESAVEKGSSRDIRAAAIHAAAFATRIRDWKLAEHALETMLGETPGDYGAWRALADARTRLRKDPEETWKQLIEQQPDDPRAHVAYARFLIAEWKLDDALAYLEEQAERGIDPPSLRSAIASTQIAANRLEAAQETVTKLEEEHPGHPRSVIARAQLDIRRGRVGKAVRDLSALTERQDESDAWLLLARAQKASGKLAQALHSADKAIETSEGLAVEERSLRARILAAQDEWPEVIRTLDELGEQVALVADDQVLLARARYENGQPRHARTLLLPLVESRKPPPEALVEYARREGDDPEARARVRTPLDRVIRRDPRNWSALQQLTRIDLVDGNAQAALTRLDQVVKRLGDETTPPVHLLRAQVAAEVGREEGLIEEVELAFEGEPRLRGALELLVALHLRQGEPAKALAAAELAKEKGAMDAERRLLLGRLYRANGRDADAVRTLEEALAKDDENPSVYFHMGMALQALDRREEATRALEKALAIGTTFPEAELAREALAGARSAGAS